MMVTGELLAFENDMRFAEDSMRRMLARLSAHVDHSFEHEINLGKGLLPNSVLDYDAKEVQDKKLEELDQAPGMLGPVHIQHDVCQ